MGPSAASRASKRRAAEREVDEAPAGARPDPARAPLKAGYPFKAALDLAELDDRGRPSAIWNGRACELSRGHIVFSSRRMCYEERQLLIAVHLVDDRPVPLFGTVTKSVYDGDGLYRTSVTLAPLPEPDTVQVWLSKVQPRS